MNPVRSEETDANDGTHLIIQYIQARELLPFVSVLEYVRLFSDRLNACRFVLGMRICNVNFYVCDGHTIRLTAAGDWASRWLHRGR